MWRNESGGPQYVDTELTRHEGREAKNKRTYVTEVNGSITLDLYSGWCLEGEELKFKLQQLPIKICSMTSLERLWVSHNNLSSIPDQFDQLSNLRELFLHHNALPNLPMPLCGLPNLQILWLSSNQITEVPSEIKNLKSLKRLHLDHNLIDVFPAGICELTQLEILYLNHNQIKFIPDSIGKIANLRRVSLHFNKISTVPEGFIHLASLEFVNLQNNEISLVPREFERFCRLIEEKKGIVQTANNPFVVPRMKQKLSVTGTAPSIHSPKGNRRHSEHHGLRDRSASSSDIRSSRVSLPFGGLPENGDHHLIGKKKSSTLNV